MFHKFKTRFRSHTVLIFLTILLNLNHIRRINGFTSSSLSSPNRPPHPLDPLTEDEIHSTVQIIQSYHFNPNWVFNYINLKEPQKSSLLPYFLYNKDPPPHSPFRLPRRSFTILFDRSKKGVFEVTVNLDSGRIEKWIQAPSGAQPPFSFEEMLEAERIVRSHPEVIRRCREQGWDNMSLVNGDQWSMGYIGDRKEYLGRRLLQLYIYGRAFENDNEYAHPFDFLCVVDVNEKRIINIEELPTHEDFNALNKTGSRVPRKTSNYHPDLRDPDSFRKDFKPVNISNPHGVNFKVEGNTISWQKFKLRLGFNGREGPVLHHVTYKDGKEVRPLFYRMSLAEMFIPYGDPRPPFHRKAVYDEGQYGVGFLIASLQPGYDFLGEAHCFDGLLNNDKGQPLPRERVLCVHEEDSGILWKHTDFRSGKSALVRSQRLALTFIANLGNYDYIHAWNFYLDGTIEFNVKLSGILSTNLLAVGENAPPYGTLVAPQVFAQNHQHFFTLRIDPDIDGSGNTVVVKDVVPLKAASGSKGNPYGNGFTTKETVIRTAAEGRTKIAPEKGRTWLIKNPSRNNPYTKEPVSWKLMSWPSPRSMFKENSPLREQSAFLDYMTWVTPYNDEQMFPAGYYLNNSGLPEWVGRDPKANVENEDLVVWFNLGVNHVRRTEDFPVMPVETCGIFLKPTNFFIENPALDVPGPKKKEQKC